MNKPVYHPTGVSVVPAKITRPSSNGIYLRENLFHKLDCLRERSIIWVSGPAGSGKTSLASSYIGSRGVPHIWYQIDEGDSDMATFFYFMGLAGSEASPYRRPLPLFTPGSAVSKAFARMFFEELFERLEKPAVIVLDNYQDIHPENQLHRAIRDGLSVIPKKINVLILSRAEPPPDLARIRAGHSMNMIDSKGLRLSPEETHGIVRLIGQREYSDEVIDLLHRKADGWVAGLLLLLKRTEIEDIDPLFLSRFTPEEVFDYFASEIFQNTDQEVREFLLKTAIFPKMTSRMAANLTGIRNTDQILSDLNRNHYFTDRRIGMETTYEYHPLFREFLMARAKNTFTSQQLAQLQKKGGKLLERDGQIEAAVGLLNESGDIQSIMRLILSHAPKLMQQGRNQTLEQWLKSVPDEMVSGEPWLLYWLGACQVPTDTLKAISFFEKALTLFEDRRDPNGILLALCGIIDAIAYGIRRFELFDRWIPKLIAYCNEFRPFPTPELEIRVTMSLQNAMTVRQPQHPDLKTWQEHALSLLHSGMALGEDIKIQLVIPLIFNRISSGDLAEAEVFIENYRYLSESPDVSPLAQITFKNLEAFCRWTSGRFEECQKAVDEALQKASKADVHFFSPMVKAHGACGALSAGLLDLTDAVVKEIGPEFERQGAWEKGLYHVLATWLALYQKNFVRARFHSQHSLVNVEEEGMPMSIAVCHLGHALALHASGDLDQAEANLAQALSICRQVRVLQVEFRCHLAKAEFAFDRGDEVAAKASLSAALSLGKEQGYINSWLWISEPIAELCCKALEADIEVDYVCELVRKRKLMPNKPPLHLAEWPWPIKIHTLGRFGLEIDGKSVQYGRKAQRRPLNMLKVMIALGGSNIKEESISDALWPDAEGDMAHQSYATTLYRLRRLLESQEAIQRRDGRLTLDRGYVWLDIWAFERLLDEAEAVLLNAQDLEMPSEAMELIQRAIEIYQGPFLPTEALEPWSVSLRERLRSKFSRSIWKVGSYLEATEAWEQAIEWYRKALEKDDLVEVFYRHLMLIYRRIGDNSMALSVYERCREVFMNTLAVKPSPKTEAIRKTLHLH